MKVNKELVKGSTVILILKSLERQPMYGYEMIKGIEIHSDGVFNLKEGTLYPILHSLEASGMLESYWLSEGSRPRKYYRITDKGREELKEKQAEWATFRSAVDRVLGRPLYAD